MRYSSRLVDWNGLKGLSSIATTSTSHWLLSTLEHITDVMCRTTIAKAQSHSIGSKPVIGLKPTYARVMVCGS